MSDCLSCVEIKRLWVELFNQTTICLANIWRIGVDVLEVVQLAENCPAANDAEDLSSNLGLYIGVGVAAGLLIVGAFGFGIYHFYKRWDHENLGNDIEMQPIIPAPRPHPQPPAAAVLANANAILQEINLLDEDEEEVLFHSPRHRQQQQQQQRQNPNPNPEPEPEPEPAPDPNPNLNPNPADQNPDPEPEPEPEPAPDPNPNPNLADPNPADPNPGDLNREPEPEPVPDPAHHLAVPDAIPIPDPNPIGEGNEPARIEWDLDERWERTRSGRVTRPPTRLGFDD